MEFDSAAKKIVSDSICSAVCIDNTFVEPYALEDGSDDLGFKTPKELYESFKKQNCVLDVYRYIDFESWEKKKESILKGKDLLILDWELSDGDPKFKEALAILLEAVRKESLPFVYIYTQEIDLEKVVLNISAYFSGNTSEKLKEKYDLFCNDLEDFPEVEDASKLLMGIIEKCKEIVIYPYNLKSIRSQIFAYFKEKLVSDNIGKFYQNFLDMGKKVFESENDEIFLKNLGIFLNKGYLPKNPILDVDIYPIQGEKYAYLIHDTIVKISTKKVTTTTNAAADVISPDEVYSELSKTICSRPQNFLSLLGLELRNLYRDSSSIIGKDLNEIDEIAFFQHQNSMKDEEVERFHEFLKNIWKDEISSFLLSQNPLLFSVLEDYKVKKDINSELESYEKNLLIQHLSRLNYYYSISRNHQKLSRKIRFGDIFSIKFIEEGTSLPSYPFFLCITPHCDCLRPEKIKNSLFFVGGNEITLKKGLERGDSGFISFIMVNKKIICIEWKATPFTIYISVDANNIIKPTECDLSGKKIVISHLAHQKENYTQRIANESFSKANRVGIDFAKFEAEVEKT